MQRSIGRVRPRRGTANAVVCIVALGVVTSCVSTPGDVKTGGNSSSTAQPASTAVNATGATRKERVEVVKAYYAIKESVYMGDGAFDRYVAYKYDKSGTQLLEKATYEPSRPEPVEKLSYYYNGDTLYSLTVSDYEGKTVSRTVYERDAAGRVVKETVYGLKDVVMSISTYAYDAVGNKAEWRVASAKGVVLAVTRYAYSGARLDLIVLQGVVERPAGRIQLAYGKDGLLVSKSYFDAKDKLEKTETFVYKDGRLTDGRLLGADGSPQRRVIGEYDANGNLSKTTTYDGSGRAREVRVYEYASREERRTVYYE